MIYFIVAVVYFVVLILMVIAHHMFCTWRARKELERDQMLFVEALFASMDITMEEVNEADEAIEYVD